MAKNLVKPMDPHELQNRFSTAQAHMMQGESTPFTFEDFQPFIDRLPQREIDLIEMYYREQKKQKDIAEFFGVTQGAISHRLSRARKRLAFLRDMPKIAKGTTLRGLLESHFDGFDVDVIVFMIETTCQSRTADLLNEKHRLNGRDRMTQVKVRHKFDRSINRMSKLKGEHMETCHKLAEYVKDHLYMLHEVILPHFNRGSHARYEEVR